MPWSFRYRKTIRLLPGVRINLSRRGPSFTLGWPRLLSWNSRSRATTIDTPGPGSIRYRPRRKR